MLLENPSPDQSPISLLRALKLSFGELLSFIKKQLVQFKDRWKSSNPFIKAYLIISGLFLFCLLFYLWPLIIGFLTTKKLYKAENQSNHNLAVTTAAILTLVFSSIWFAAASSTARKQIASENDQTVAVVESEPDKQNNSEQDNEQTSREQLEQQLAEERQNRETLEAQIASAQAINDDLPEKVDGLETDLDTAKNANMLTINYEQDRLYEVLQVVDGDTIKLSDLGTIRLIGIDTPETKDPRTIVQCFGEEASARAHELLDGQKVYLEFDDSQGRLDKYGRTLAYVFREDRLFFNQEMISQGYAHEYTYILPYKYQDEFKAAEQKAIENNRGFWATDTCAGNTTKAKMEVIPEPEPEPAPTPAPVLIADDPSPEPEQPVGFSCTVYKTCDQMASCEEAYFYLNTCDHKDRDGDNDGVPCENICPGGQNTPALEPEPEPEPTPAPQSATPSFTCNCSKTCTQIKTCEEAYYQLNTCGCSVRDGDNDGIPCESLCK